MPTINKKKLCNKHGFFTGDRCPKCIQESNKEYDTTLRAKDRKKIYNSKRWKSIREKVLIRDGMICVKCGSIANEVDHILELQDRPDLAFDLENLQSICTSCHVKKTKQEKQNRKI